MPLCPALTLRLAAQPIPSAIRPVVAATGQLPEALLIPSATAPIVTTAATPSAVAPTPSATAPIAIVMATRRAAVLTALATQLADSCLTIYSSPHLFGPRPNSGVTFIKPYGPLLRRQFMDGVSDELVSCPQRRECVQCFVGSLLVIVGL